MKTLYTGQKGFELFNKGLSFWASDVKLTDGDLAFTVDDEDINLVVKRDDCNLYSVICFDSVEWIKNQF